MQQPAVKAYEVPGAVVSLADDWIIRVLGEADGWRLDQDDVAVSLPFGQADNVIVSAIKAAARQDESLVLATMRVEHGLSLGPAIALLLTGLVQCMGGDPRVVPFPIGRGERIGIVSRSRDVRDYLGDSVVALTRPATRVCQFPTERIRRSGRIEPGFYGQLGLRQRRSLQSIDHGPGLLLYDLTPLQDATSVPHCRVVIGELSESDSPELVSRFVQFARQTQAQFIFPIISVFDSKKIEMLRAEGFAVASIRSPYSGATHPLPTFDAVGSASPDHTRVTFSSIDPSHPTALALFRAYRRLVELQRAVGDYDIYYVREAWNILEALSSVCVPLKKYEAHRRLAPALKTVEHILFRLKTPHYGRIAPDVLDAFRLRWTDVLTSLGEAYAALSKSNPLYESIADGILYGDSAITTLLPSSLLSTALREELMIEYGWDGLHPTLASVRVSSRGQEVHRRIRTTGFRRGSIPRIWSLLPEDIEIVGYPHEIWSFQRYRTRLESDLSYERLSENRRVLSHLFGDAQVCSGSMPLTTAEFVVPNIDLQRLWEQSATHAIIGYTEQTFIDEPPDEEIDFAVDIAANDQGDVISDEIEGIGDDSVVVEFRDGTRQEFSARSEVLVVLADENKTSLTSVEALLPGDTVLLFSDNEHRNAFQAILSRVRHLIDVDERYLEKWRVAMDAARLRWPINDSAALRDYYNALRSYKCARTEQTMRNWITGRMMAPDDAEDIACILQAVGMKGDVATLASAMDREIDRVRAFHRALGRRFTRRFEAIAEQAEATSRIDAEIDEFLQDCDTRIVERVTDSSGSVTAEPTLFEYGEFSK